MSAQGQQKGGQGQYQQQGYGQQSFTPFTGGQDYGGSYYSMGNSMRPSFNNMNNGNPLGRGGPVNPAVNPGAPTGTPMQNPFAGPLNLTGNLGGSLGNVANGNPLAPGGNIDSNFGPGAGSGWGGSANPFSAYTQAGSNQPLPYGSTNGTFVPPQGFDPTAHYMNFDWNNISPTTRGFLGYRG